MTIDDRARAASNEVHEGLAAVSPPDAHAVVRRAHRRRGMTAAAAGLVVALAVGLGLAAAAHEPAAESPVSPIPSVDGWSRVDKADAGLAAGSSLSAVAADDDTAVLGGAVAPGGDWEAALWWTEDGLTWQEADHPSTPGEVFAVALHDGVAVATGSSSTGGGTDFVWRSEDGGRSWVRVDIGDDLFDQAAPEMGRPFVDQLLWFDGMWVAAGGSSTGYAGIWTSTDGEAWDQVLETEEGGSIGLTTGDGGLVAFAGDSVWTTNDPTTWGEPSPMFLPADRVIGSMASGGNVAVGQSPRDHLVQQLLHAVEPWRWEVDPTFDQDFAGQYLTRTDRFGDLEVVTGADRQNRPNAWVRLDTNGDWQPIPEALRGSPGGILFLTADLDGRLLVLGTAPELDRYYVFDAGDPAVPTTSTVPVDEGSASTPGSMAWFRQESGVEGFDPARATVGVTTVGQVEGVVEPSVLRTIRTVEPADYGVSTVEEIPVAVGLYRGEPGQFGVPLDGSLDEGFDSLLIVSTLDLGGARIRSSGPASRFDGIEAVLTPVG